MSSREESSSEALVFLIVSALALTVTNRLANLTYGVVVVRSLCSVSHKIKPRERVCWKACFCVERSLCVRSEE